MRRRNFLALLASALAAIPFAAAAQKASTIPRVGFLGNSTSALEANLVGAFRKGLRDLRYVEGQNVLIEYRWAEGSYERFPSLIADLVGLKVNVIVTAGTPAALAVKKTAPSMHRGYRLAPPPSRSSANPPQRLPGTFLCPCAVA